MSKSSQRYCRRDRARPSSSSLLFSLLLAPPRASSDTFNLFRRTRCIYSSRRDIMILHFDRASGIRPAIYRESQSIGTPTHSRTQWVGRIILQDIRHRLLGEANNGRENSKKLNHWCHRGMVTERPVAQTPPSCRPTAFARALLARATTGASTPVLLPQLLPPLKPDRHPIPRRC